MTLLTELLDKDRELLIQARSITPESLSALLQITGESIVLFTAVFLVILWLIGVKKNRATEKYQALSIFLTIVAVFGFYAVINFCIPQWRPNPQEVAGGVKALIPHPLDNSFPSGHSLFTGAFIVGLIRHYPNRYILMIAILLGILTTCSRVFAGIHYPGDIV